MKILLLFDIYFLDVDFLAHKIQNVNIWSIENEKCSDQNVEVIR